MTIKFQTTDNIEQCLDIRHKVFILGQNVPPDLEIDGLDDTARHYIGLDQDRPVATCRVRFIKDTAKIERVAVLDLYRGQGIGRDFMAFVLKDQAQNPDIHYLKLSAQVTVVPFYESLGFVSSGTIYKDAGIDHIDMARPI
ncbi:MAG: GNAT family N-acetyltransferase [Pseudomonadota bacterium]